MKLSLASHTSFPDTHNTYHLLRRTQETLAVIIICCVWGAVLSPGRGQDLTPWSHLCYCILHIVTICMCACPPLSLAFHPQDLTQSHCLIRMVDWLNSCLVAAIFSTTPLFPPRAILCVSCIVIPQLEVKGMQTSCQLVFLLPTGASSVFAIKNPSSPSPSLHQCTFGSNWRLYIPIL